MDITSLPQALYSFILGIFQYFYDVFALFVYVLYAIGNIFHIILQPFLFIVEMARNAFVSPADMANATSSVSGFFSTSTASILGSATGISSSVWFGIVFSLMVVLMFLGAFKEFKHV